MTISTIFNAVSPASAGTWRAKKKKPFHVKLELFKPPFNETFISAIMNGCNSIIQDYVTTYDTNDTYNDK